MSQNKQHTLAKSVSVEGIGIHTGYDADGGRGVLPTGGGNLL